ncbi:hypothetical protein AC1031_008842 [Aphanomyces cochlioides]|nr:hypothetical protein AC1031_008842 [Aphanomyces cochlioides]
MTTTLSFPESFVNDLVLDGLFDQASCGSLSDDGLDLDCDIDSVTTESLDKLWKGISNDGMTNNADKTTKYLEKLYCMLEQCPESIAAWTENGTSFAIFDSDTLEKVMIPRFFKPIKFESFMRQLNSYGFRKSKYMVNDTTVVAFRHANFVRGKSDDLLKIKRRRRVKRNGAKSFDDMNDEQLRNSMRDLMSFVQTLHQELAQTKQLIQSMTDVKPTIIALTTLG